MEHKSFLRVIQHEDFLLEGVEDFYPNADQNSITNIIHDLVFSDSAVYFFYEGRKYPLIGGHPFRLTHYYHIGQNSFSTIEYGPRKKDFNIFILGEQPSYKEEQDRLNFTGDFGRVLYFTLKEYGFNSFDDCYVANLIRIRGPVAQKTYLAHAFLPLLLYELSYIRPKFILCLGTQALRVFTTKKMDDVIQNPIELQIEQKVCNEIISWETKVFAAPLSAIREYSELLRFKDAIRRFVNHLQGKPISSQVPIPPTQLIKTDEQLKQLIDRIISAADKELQIVTCDLEWSGRTPCMEGAFLRFIGLYWENTAYIIYVADSFANYVFDLKFLAEQIDRLFAHPNIQIVGHYFVSDAVWLLSLGCKNIIDKFLIPENIDSPNFPGIFDTLNAHHAYDETGTFGLKDAAKILLGYEPWDKGVVQYVKDADLEGYGAVPDSILVPYLARDLYVTHQLREYHIKRLNGDRFGNSCWRAFAISSRSLAAYAEMSHVGVRVDIRGLDALRTAYERKLQDLEMQMKAAVGSDFNPRSNQQKIIVLFGPDYILPTNRKINDRIKLPSLKLEPFKATDGSSWRPELKGLQNPSTDLESLRYLSLKYPECNLVKLLYDYQLVSQLVKTFLGPNGLAKFVCRERRIHPMYYPYLETRRASSSKPNMQNLPAEEKEEIYKRIMGVYYPGPIRAVFIADEGDLFVSADFVAAELLMLGLMAREEKLIADYQRTILPDDDPNKLDIHSFVAVTAFGLNCEPKKNALNELGFGHLRLAAKRIIFGLNYGRSAESVLQQLISSGLNITLDDVNKIIQTIYNQYPRIPEFQEEVRKRVKEKKWLANCFGGYRRFEISRSSDAIAEQEREALNFTCQSGVADAISIALANFMSHPLKKELGYRIVMQHHDALTFLVPKDNVLKFREIIDECMVKGVTLRMVDLDGNVVDDREFHFGVSVEVNTFFS